MADKKKTKKIRFATVWLAGCSGCHMSFLDLDERLLELFELIELVYSPIADLKTFPKKVDVTLVEGALANTDNLELLQLVRERSELVVSFGDCAVTGCLTALRNHTQADRLLEEVYHEGPEQMPYPLEPDGPLPTLLPKVLPLHRVIEIDAFIPGCPPNTARIWTAVSALLRGEPVVLNEEMRRFGNALPHPARSGLK